MRVITLTSPMLNFWVAKARGLKTLFDHRTENSVSVIDPESGTPTPFQPCRDWSQAGPILADGWYDIESTLIDWLGPNWSYVTAFKEDPLTWFMRAFVASQFGDEVEKWPTTDQDS
jgi:hypothetical protein